MHVIRLKECQPGSHHASRLEWSLTAAVYWEHQSWFGHKRVISGKDEARVSKEDCWFATDSWLPVSEVLETITKI